MQSSNYCKVSILSPKMLWCHTLRTWYLFVGSSPSLLARDTFPKLGVNLPLRLPWQVASAEAKGRRELQESRSLAAAMEDRASSLQEQASPDVAWVQTAAAIYAYLMKTRTFIRPFYGGDMSKCVTFNYHVGLPTLTRLKSTLAVYSLRLNRNLSPCIYLAMLWLTWGTQTLEAFTFS